jgi:biopolymer transport protein ExbD
MKQDYSLNPTTRSGRPRRPVEIAMTPMIDVIFLLLVFFLATSSFQKVENLLPAGISQEASSEQGSSSDPPPTTDEMVEQVVIKISGDADSTEITLNDSPIADLATLAQRLQTISEIKTDLPVIVDPSPDVPVETAIAAYDAARQAAFLRVYFAVHQR